MEPKQKKKPTEFFETQKSTKMAAASKAWGIDPKKKEGEALLKFFGAGGSKEGFEQALDRTRLTFEVIAQLAASSGLKIIKIGNKCDLPNFIPGGEQPFEDTVFYLPKKLAYLIPGVDCEVGSLYSAILIKTVGFKIDRLPITEFVEKATVNAFLSGDSAVSACTVCFEDAPDFDDKVACVYCSTILCMSCFVDLVMLGSDGVGDAAESKRTDELVIAELSFPCPKCRRDFSGEKVGQICVEYTTQYPSARGSLDADKYKFVCEVSVKHTADFYKALRGYRTSDYASVTHSSAAAAGSRRREEPKKKAVVRAAAGERLVQRRKNAGMGWKCGCGNCEKPFADRKHWQRCPKCVKCKRIAYCSTECRRKHGPEHVVECSGGRKRKHKRKKRR